MLLVFTIHASKILIVRGKVVKVNMIFAIQFTQFNPLGMSQTHNGLISPMDRALHPVIIKVRLRFLVTPELFQILFQPLGLLFNCKDHVHFLS